MNEFENIIGLIENYRMSIVNIGATDPFFNRENGPFRVTATLHNGTILTEVIETDNFCEAVIGMVNYIHSVEEDGVYAE